MISFFHSLYRFRHALRIQIWVDLKTSVATTRLGVLWWILDPLLLMAIYYFIVMKVFNRGGEGVPFFSALRDNCMAKL